MSDLRDRIEKDEGSLQKLMASIPGFSGYRERQLRRKADQMIREHLVGLLDDTRRVMKRTISKWADQGKLEQLDALDRLLGKLTKVRDNLRFADYGYTGWFDAAKIKEDELDSLYDYDLGLREQIMRIDEVVGGLAGAEESQLAEHVANVTEEVARLAHAIDHRGEITAELVP